MRRQRKRLMAEINVVPYIDVMLVLLVIFMITAPLLMQGVKVNLPKVASQPIAVKERAPIIVSVDAKGQFYLNIANNPRKPVLEHTIYTQVAAALRVAKEQHQNRAVLIKGDSRVNYGDIMRAMVLLQQAGAPTVGLITKAPPSLKNMNS